MRGDCAVTTQSFSYGLTVAESLRDLPDSPRCPIADIIEDKEILERVFREYQSVKRLGVRFDQSIPAGYLVALDIEVAAIEARENERRQREAKARAQRSRGRCRS